MVHPLKISVVTPSFNQGEYIEDAIQSVLAQRHSNIEHIIIDGGSTDATLDVLRRYPHLRVVSEPDRGQSDALNKGFRMATGDLVGWLNADDYYLPRAFEQVSQWFVSSGQPADVFYGDCFFVDEKGGFVRAKLDSNFSYRTLLYSKHCFIPTTSTFFRRGALAGKTELDITLKVTMDFDFFVRLAKDGASFTHIPKPLAAFRWHSSNVSVRYEQLRREERTRVQHRESGINSRYLVRGLTSAYHLLRIAKKVLGGQYWRQRDLASFRGVGTRWFLDDRTMIDTESILRAL